jgi:hypothetical protein
MPSAAKKITFSAEGFAAGFVEAGAAATAAGTRENRTASAIKPYNARLNLEVDMQTPFFLIDHPKPGALNWSAGTGAGNGNLVSRRLRLDDPRWKRINKHGNSPTEIERAGHHLLTRPGNNRMSAWKFVRRESAATLPVIGLPPETKRAYYTKCVQIARPVGPKYHSIWGKIN